MFVEYSKESVMLSEGPGLTVLLLAKLTEKTEERVSVNSTAALHPSHPPYPTPLGGHKAQS